MRVRVRAVGASASETVRVECAPETTRGELMLSVAEATGVPLSSLKLSLNKHSEIEGEATDFVSSLGICGGDLLWVLGDSNSAAREPQGRTTRVEPAAEERPTEVPQQSDLGAQDAAVTPMGDNDCAGGYPASGGAAAGCKRVNEEA
eukprot:CAMPEP_0177752526 /NCGR_PEP_ID=MMETSP0491_2-20121128/967_1 /TAXON_ID=63592 /ORGANISM="Tetraselmis chuii, Strain PLY429" /LENGTH=146 /DNA_ID=CAMNT_0019267737 /DNA_START=150 /DNA_END=587 /DNA_ORIENTATION=-